MNEKTSIMPHIIIFSIILLAIGLCYKHEPRNTSSVVTETPNKYITEKRTLASIEEVKYVADDYIKELKKSYKHKKYSKKEKDFIIGLIRVALEEEFKYGIPANIKIAQSIIESGWGKDGIALNHNNYFGIKHKKYYSEEEKPLVKSFVKLQTHEYDKNGNKYYQDDNFISYETRWASIRHHSIFLKRQMEVSSRKHYRNLKNIPSHDYQSWAWNLQKAGYATSPTYASKLIHIIHYYKLQDINLSRIVTKL